MIVDMSGSVASEMPCRASPSDDLNLPTWALFVDPWTQTCVPAG